MEGRKEERVVIEEIVILVLVVVLVKVVSEVVGEEVMSRKTKNGKRWVKI